VSDAVVTLEGVWKAYPRYEPGVRTVRGIVARRVPAFARSGATRWALRDVSLAARAGEAVGIIGANGAGKSTLLRLASGLGRPTRGTISLPERTASVLSLGDAFDMSLTGRENALTAAIVAGMRRRDAAARMPGILEFAELEAFADAPMRTYSDGMRLRLAFGVIAQLEPRALLLDEVIAVGDLRFQAKCMQRVQDLRDGGTTVLFASHSLEQVADECDRAIWLQGGGVRASGEAGAVVAAYRDAMRSATMERTPVAAADGDGLELRRNRFGSQEVRIASVAVRAGDSADAAELASGAGLRVTLELEADTPVEDPIVGVSVHRAGDGVVCLDLSSEATDLRLGAVSRCTVELAIERLDLVPGDYLVDVGVYPRDWSYAYDYHWQAYPLRVTGRGGGQGVVSPPVGWRRTA
jgi:lipopolysaccharide transport system ATP-binding protein